ncbi:hypothetical protein FB470_006488 [Amycolatopsis thermophila]|uniref:ATP-cone domain-containing protein n=1 Tax=Amycolatopsis thermophila TaxID=206084 RepID=A0ABU0F586_9PSEU|nr:hypothetical protein [Amycolatopsis thermophila]
MDGDVSVEPKIVIKRQRGRITEVDEMVISLAAKAW